MIRSKGGDYSREAIIFNILVAAIKISVKGERLFEGGDYFKYFGQRGRLFEGGDYFKYFGQRRRLFEGGDYFKYFGQRWAIIRGTAITRGNMVVN